MIRFENGMLVLDYPMTKEHAQVMKDFVQYIREQEQERIIKELEANEHIWRERVVLVALKALIKGETNGS